MVDNKRDTKGEIYTIYIIKTQFLEISMAYLWSFNFIAKNLKCIVIKLDVFLNKAK